MTEPRWLAIARKYIGQEEMPGPGSNTWIRSLWQKLKGGAWFWTHFGSDDSRLPWCGAFCAYAMQEAGLPYPQRYASAKAWLDWGQPLPRDLLGCIVVFERAGGGHVGFVVGRNALGQLLVLGGNQGNRVSIAAFPTSRVLGYRWPAGLEYYTAAPVPILASNGAPLSHSEA